ncbi:serine hydrolase domain-containing protein [Nonomuraea lactucae]|uniref:serine hydrolase domain-containing protein n=1 Tax=Nonomuraea lactucae TaxID=2249762 RepID=UPI001F06321F|nr:serine hydrolase domain-containing protein [Nonomuraea lactucae]
MAGIVTAGRAIVRSSRSEPTWARGSPRSPLRLGSLSKCVTASALLGLAADGLIDLDASPSDYVRFPAAQWPVQVRHLLSHSAGFGLHVHWSDRLNPAAVWGLRVGSLTRVDRLAAVPQSFEPGTGWLYGHLSSALAERIIASRVGGPFSEWMNDHFLPRCGMHTAAFGCRSRHQHVVPGTARVVGRLVRLPYLAPASEAACGLSASLDDMLTYAGSIAAGHGPGLSADVCLAHLSNGLPKRPDCPFVTTGFRSTAVAGHTLIIHGGNWWGYSASLVLDRCCGLAVICLVSGPPVGAAQATALEILLRVVHDTGQRLEPVVIPNERWEFRGMPPHADLHLVLRAGRHAGLLASWRWGRGPIRRAPVLRDVRNPQGRFVARSAHAKIEIALAGRVGEEVMWASGSRHRFPVIAALRPTRSGRTAFWQEVD